MEKHHHERGASLIEYTFVVAFIAVISLSAVDAFGKEVSSKYQEHAERLDLISVDLDNVGCGDALHDGEGCDPLGG